MALKPANKYQILQQCHIIKTLSTISKLLISLSGKSCTNTFLAKPKIPNSKGQNSKIYSGARKTFRKTLHHKDFDLPCSNEIYRFEKIVYCAKQNV